VSALRKEGQDWEREATKLAFYEISVSHLGNAHEIQLQMERGSLRFSGDSTSTLKDRAPNQAEAQ